MIDSEIHILLVDDMLIEFPDKYGLDIDELRDKLIVIAESTSIYPGLKKIYIDFE